MKNKAMMLASVALLLASATFAQSVENDDMYFNSTHRAALKASQKATYSASIKKAKKTQVEEEEFINPTDSYSARNVNPEFAARSNSQTAQADDQDYFVSNYQYQASTNLNNWNNSYISRNSNPMYMSNYYGSSINSWNSPYYGSAYDSWGNPWCNPYYRSGWSSSFSYYWGSSYNYGWGGSGMGIGMSYGYGNSYMNSYSPWGPSYGYGMYYPSTVVVVNNYGNYGEAGRNIVYGKRATRSGTVTAPQVASSTRTRSTYEATPTGGRAISAGRISSTGRSQRQEDYYNRSWRNSQQYSPRSSSDSWRSSYDRSTNSGSYNRSNSSNSSSTMNRSSGTVRSSAPASSGSNGRSRGRD